MPSALHALSASSARASSFATRSIRQLFPPLSHSDSVRVNNLNVSILPVLQSRVILFRELFVVRIDILVLLWYIIFDSRLSREYAFFGSARAFEPLTRTVCFCCFCIFLLDIYQFLQYTKYRRSVLAEFSTFGGIRGLDRGTCVVLFRDYNLMQIEPIGSFSLFDDNAEQGKCVKPPITISII